MTRGRHCYTDDIDVREHFTGRTKDAHPMPVCDYLCPLDRLIHHADEVRPGQGGIETRMMLSQMSDANDACPKGCHTSRLISRLVRVS
jgi:hypothetical protein